MVRKAGIRVVSCRENWQRALSGVSIQGSVHLYLAPPLPQYLWVPIPQVLTLQRAPQKRDGRLKETVRLPKWSTLDSVRVSSLQ